MAFASSIASAGALVPGDVVVADQFAAAVIKIDPHTGAQTVISAHGVFATPSGAARSSSR